MSWPGRPTFGCWEINAYFDTAARKGFYGVVDAMVEGREYNDCLGGGHRPLRALPHPCRDRNARKVPGLQQTIETVPDLTPVRRPIVAKRQQLRTVGDLVPRQSAGPAARSRSLHGSGRPGGQSRASATAIPAGPGTVKQAPAPLPAAGAGTPLAAWRWNGAGLAQSVVSPATATAMGPPPLRAAGGPAGHLPAHGRGRGPGWCHGQGAAAWHTPGLPPPPEPAQARVTGPGSQRGAGSGSGTGGLPPAPQQGALRG